MIKCLYMESTDSNQNSYRVKLFADTKAEVVAGAEEIVGLPEGATMEIGSRVVTAAAEVAFMKSNGQWNWI